MRATVIMAGAMLLISPPAAAAQADQSAAVLTAVRRVIATENPGRRRVEYPSRDSVSAALLCTGQGRCRYPDNTVRVVIAPPAFPHPDTAIVTVYHHFNSVRGADTVSSGGPTNYVFVRIVGRWSFLSRRRFEGPPLPDTPPVRRDSAPAATSTRSPP